MSEEIILPNIRKMFIPDPGYIICDADLAGADAQVVAWEAEDEDLKAAFRAGLDVHSKNAEDMFGREFTKLEGVARHKKRQQCKHAVHGTNYVGSAYAVARHPSINWLTHEAEKFQKRWFDLHPGIQRWHKRTQRQLDTNRTVTNAFGYRRVFFDRSDACLPEAIAWVPQSTVALTTFEGAIRLEESKRYVQMLLQVHDSLVFQIPKTKKQEYGEIQKALEVPIPYSDPLVIRWGLKVSEKSWGECAKPE